MGEKKAVEAAAIWVDPSRLKLWADNPRHNDGAVPRVMESIREFGFAAPIVAQSGTERVIAGHTRLKAALALGLTSVPVRYLDVTDAQADRLTVADNKLGEIAEWDNDKLIELLKDAIPRLRRVAVFTNPDNAATGLALQAMDIAAKELNVSLLRFSVRPPGDLDGAFAAMARDNADALAVEAAQLMEAHKINALLVVDGDRRVVGALNIHDLLRARVV